MIFTKSIVVKLLILTLLICCSHAAKITRTNTKAMINSTAESDKTSKLAVVTATKATPDDYDDDDDDDDDNDAEVDVENDDISSEEADDAAEKTALEPAAPTSLSVWGIVRGVWNWIKSDFTEGLFGDDDDAARSVGEGRTFGKIRRLQMALIPIVFKFGVLSAMVAFLVAIGLKTLFLVKILLAMNALALLGKLFTLKHDFGHHEHHHPAPPPSWGWSPHTFGGWSQGASLAAVPDHQPTKEIHLHIHGAQGQPQVQAWSSGATQQQGWESRSDPYNAYEHYNTVQDQNDYSNSAPSVYQGLQQVNANYPANHRMF